MRISFDLLYIRPNTFAISFVMYELSCDILVRLDACGALAATLTGRGKKKKDGMVWGVKL